MKKYIIVGLFSLAILLGGLFVSTNIAHAGYVKGYYKSSTGRYVNSYYRSNSNRTKIDNYSTRGNYNPYTGSKGYKNPYKY